MSNVELTVRAELTAGGAKSGDQISRGGTYMKRNGSAMRSQLSRTCDSHAEPKLSRFPRMPLHELAEQSWLHPGYIRNGFGSVMR